jgi:GxxExxY protein
MEDKQLILKDEVYVIVGAAIEVLNGIGHGLIEKPYENALVVEFKLRDIRLHQQARFPVHYKGVQVGEFVPDLIASPTTSAAR